MNRQLAIDFAVAIVVGLVMIIMALVLLAQEARKDEEIIESYMTE